jgi:small subunit ribosomal protein S12
MPIVKVINIGEFGARKMIQQRKKKRWKKTTYKVRTLRLREKVDPFECAPQAKGIVLAKKGIEQKQPSSGIIKCVRVQLLKNGKEITAFVPGNESIKLVNEHDEVMLEGVGGSQGGPVGSMWGVRWKVTKINGKSLDGLMKAAKAGVKKK